MIKIVPKGFSAAILHTHTTHSDGLVSPQEVVRLASVFGIRVVAITDHDTLSGFGEAQMAGRKFGVEVIAGQEVQTSMPRGLHVVGLFLKKGVAHSKPLLATIDEIRKQGGLAIGAHPMLRILGFILPPTGAVQLGDLKRIIAKTSFDGIELRHPFLKKEDQAILERFYTENEEKLGAAIGASDSHFGKSDMFGYLTLFPGKRASDLYRAIKERKTVPVKGYFGVKSLNDSLVQAKRALVDLAYRRYGGMFWRWTRLNFQNKEEFL